MKPVTPMKTCPDCNRGLVDKYGNPGVFRAFETLYPCKRCQGTAQVPA